MLYDAIIVGSGACGGWAAMQLCEAGMKVLLLEAGSSIDPLKEFHHTFLYEMPFRGQGRPGFLRRYSSSERNYRIMLDLAENPYTTDPETHYRWSRSRCLGGRSLHWARASDRMADYEFKSASRDGYGLDWDLTYAEIAPYYDRVERFIGVSAAAAGLPQFPDGVFLPVMPLNCAEAIFTAACKSLGWPTTHRRLAQLTQPHNRRPPCHYCGNCVNGCDVGAMFSTLSTTLPPALKTGNLELRTDSVVAEIRMKSENRARGVTYIERYTGKAVEVDARHVVLAASTLENTRLLLLSAKGGLANSSGTLGQYMMDQLGAPGVSGFLPKLKGGPSRLDDGKAAGITIPNMINYDAKTARKDFIRGYVMNATGGQSEFPQFAPYLPGYGSDWKREVKSRYVAQARVWIAGGEMLARRENFVELDPEVKDHWGIPVLKIHFTHCDNDYKLIEHFQQSAEELFRRAGGEKMPGMGEGGPRGFPGAPGSPDTGPSRAVTDSDPSRSAAREGDPKSRRQPLGGAIHEVGTARMSREPKIGVLNSYCQAHDIPNLYVFGGNAFPSTGDKHPTLTMLALTARGCERLIDSTKP
ncbi:MAG TPA: GMC family oxidoreductase [Bryobacteraceae bacterium]|jgi:choline dehydrogenase-like flavoprotein|nr:GMC family oxidoreductase [Bryobacteraceae bacterium]